MNRRRNPESGYALLFVYMMAATLAIMLYMAVPRVAFEAQRDKEQLLIDRGEQYQRAIQLYVRKYNRYPVDMQALENTQNIRFLRKQYVDPMTGKNEWRLIHVGPGGVFMDSKIYGTQKKDQPGAQQTFIATIQQFASDPTGSQGVNLATRRRQSDESGNPGGPGNNPGSPPQPQPISGPVMVLPDGRIVAATPTGIPASPSQPQPPPGALANGFPPGFQPPSGIGIQQGAAGVPPLPGQPGFQNTPNTPIAPPSSAANLINQILTTPRPGGLNGTDPTVAALQPVAGGAPVGGFSGNTGVSAGQSLGGQTIGGGIAGVASKLEQEGIKSYNERTSYDEWEFVYDISKDKSRGGGVALPRPPPQPGQNSPPLNPGSNSTGN